MKIELLKNDRMTIKGKSALNMIQNNTFPNLDLLVREVVQNSLDAAKPGEEYVKVQFQTGTFNKYIFSSYFKDIQNELQMIDEQENCGFIAIRDYNTVGLTGDISGISKTSQKENLAKLVFNVMDAQTIEGAGGSWGIGKTVYYRIGQGLVIYYSRIQLETKKYEERLVAVLIENSEKENAILRNFEDNVGIAFFGEKTDNGKIKAINNSDEIHEFLKVLSIKPYVNDETGTTVIIPFTSDEQLLNHNLRDQEDEEKDWWDKTILEYLEVSLLR